MPTTITVKALKDLPRGQTFIVAAQRDQENRPVFVRWSETSPDVVLNLGKCELLHMESSTPVLRVSVHALVMQFLDEDVALDPSVCRVVDKPPA